MKNISILCSLASCLTLLIASPAIAQHHHGGGHSSGHGGHGGHGIGHSISHSIGHSIGHGIGHSSGHHGSYYGHNDWNYVVPHHDVHHHGSYYVHNDAYYYTPTPVVRVSSPTYQTAQSYPVHTVQQPVQLQFGGNARIEDLSGRLETEVNRLCLDMHYNYQHNPGFAETYREAYALLDSAKFVHAKEHAGDREAIRQHVTQMDQAMHHVQGELRQWSRQHVRQIASGGVIEKSSSVEAVLHHLCFDVGIEPHGADQPAPAPAVTEEQAPAPSPASGGVLLSPPPAF